MRCVLRRLASLAVVCALLVMPKIASAQMLGGSRPQTTAARAQGFLTGFRTVFGVQRLRGSGMGDAFDWDLNLSVDFDVFDVGVARGNVFGYFETIIGSESRAVDPNQINYAVDLSVFLRLPRGDLAATFHHVSRHLVDRSREDSVSWNMLGVAYGDHFSIGGVEVDAGARGMGTVQRQGVDYLSQFEAYVRVARPVNATLAIIGGADAVFVPVKMEKFDRGTRNGGRAEGGVQLRTGAARLDLFVAWERRIDARSVEPFEAANWAQFGLRVAAPVP